MLHTYAIGDVHGRSDLLQTVITFCEEDAARRGGMPRIIFLGDIVDRGRDAKGCLEIVGRALADHPASIFLRGNHDDWFLRFLENDRRQLRTWFHDGGRETIDSYCDLDIDDAQRFIVSRHPGHLDLLRRSVFMVEDGPLLFVHAGVRPGVALGSQSPDDLMWIREPFLDHHGRLPRVIVHGHSVMNPPRPVVTENRISLDTGACWTGRLSVLVIDQAKQQLSFFQTDGDSGSIVKIDPVNHDRGDGTLLGDLSWLAPQQ
ncbi:MAG: serine/threonine protein phosphatase [Bosea sp.]|uniref:metallophosphoesterase n=1 Tax=Bosea sp. (in: a-proteobacteria) TaxID=1871050 RepID=UPI001AC7FFCE|nr:metallophosphoesterase [Bosea sp. (in: a-proteobacteria)]MBN9457538.1 serine/threonine protein phosphatase [Bosea sp. (in: a-proteobacteria)]